MQKNSVAIQLTVVIVLAMLTLLGISTLLGIGLQPASVLAQGGISTPPAAFTPAPLSDFGFAPDEVVALDQNDKFDLAISKTTNVAAVTAGTRVTYTLTITNNGPNSAQYFYLYDSAPTEFTDIKYTFPNTVTALNNAPDDPQTLQWLITSSLPATSRMVVTVTGVLTSLRDMQVVNTAIVTPFVQTADDIGSNNSSSETVSVAGSNPLANILYLPYISKFPTPTPLPIVLVYQETFNSGTPWYDGSLGNSCYADHTGGVYQVDVDKSNRECLPPADSDANRTYGEFEVQGYISGEGKDPDNSYGIWLNGAGGDTQYVFRIYPNIDGCSNGGKWEFQRRKSGTSTLASNSCDTHIKRGYGSSYIQTIRVAHKSTGEIKLYIDGTLVKSLVDSNQITSGDATGVYVRADDVDTRAKFDNFKVYRYQ